MGRETDRSTDVETYQLGRFLVSKEQGRLPKSRVNGVLRVMKKMRVMKKDASDEKKCE